MGDVTSDDSRPSNKSGRVNFATATIVVAAAAVLALKQFGLLPELPSASFWRDRAETAETALKEMTEERDDLLATRTLEPILQMLETLAPLLQLVQSVSETQQATLEKLASFNGSLRHVEDGLRDASEGMKALTGTIAELHGIPLRPPKP